MDHVAERLRKAWQWGSPRRERIRLDEVLAEPVPETAADVPYETGLSPWARLYNNFHVVALVAIILMTRLIRGVPLNSAALVLFVVAGLASAFAIMLGLTNLALCVRVSEAGINLKKLARTTNLPWSQINSLMAKGDASALLANGGGASLRIECSAIGAAKRRQLVDALRAHLREYGREVTLWATRSDFWYQARETFLLALPIALFVAGLTVAK